MVKSSSSNDPPGCELSLGCGNTSNTDAPDNSMPGPSSSPSPSPTSTSSSTSISPASAALASTSSGGATSTSQLATTSQQQQQTPSVVTLNILTTTGGAFTVQVHTSNSVLVLKGNVAKKLKVHKDRIRLLHRERELLEGTLQNNGLMEGSKVIVIPNVETGLLSQRPENTVMQALESLNDNQVNDFLSGKTPLNLSMRLGDHMMLIQLQLSTVTPTSSSSASGSHRSGRSSLKSRVSSNNAVAGPSGVVATSTSKSGKADKPRLIRSRRASSAALTNEAAAPATEKKTKEQVEFERIRTLLEKQFAPQPLSFHPSAPKPVVRSPDVLNYTEDSPMLDQSPIKSLSNLVSSPIQTTPLKSYPTSPECSTSATAAAPTTSNSTTTTTTATAESPAPVSPNHTDDTSKFQSCICKRLKSTDHCYASRTSQALLLHRTSNNPIARKRHSCPSSSSQSMVNFRRTKSTESMQSDTDEPMPSTSSDTGRTTTDSPVPIIADTLAAASRSLTQTLRKLSKEVFTSKSPDLASRIVDHTTAHVQSNSSSLQRKTPNSNATSAPGNGSGAVIESMKNHGKGIYSGTFSGTLNPALQDRNGRPKRDISTVIHILNDLLSATPQYTRGARISFEQTPASSTTTTNSSISRSSTKQPSTSSSSSRHPSSEVHTPTHCSKCNVELSAQPTSASTTPRCQTGECAGHSAAEQPSPVLQSSNSTRPDLTLAERCRCSRALQFDDDESATTQSPPTTPVGCHCPPPVAVAPSTDEPMNDDTTATICTKCRAVERENSQTKNKLDHIRLVMQEKKARREARKLQTAPYSPTAGSAAARLHAAAASAAATAQNSATTLAAAASTTATAGGSTTIPASSTTGAGATTTATIASTAAAEVAISPDAINNLIEVEEVVDTAA